MSTGRESRKGQFVQDYTLPKVWTLFGHDLSHSRGLKPVAHCEPLRNQYFPQILILRNFSLTLFHTFAVALLSLTNRPSL